jgi:hypothetical protein
MNRDPLINPLPGDVIAYRSYLSVSPSDPINYQLVTLVVTSVTPTIVYFKTISTRIITDGKMSLKQWHECFEILVHQTVYTTQTANCE